MGKIVDRSELPALVETLRGEGKSIVTFNGSFDVLHAGHVRCLAEAKEQGDVLIVPLNSDASVRSYKGKGRPIVPEQDRAETLAALASVDYVVLFDDINPIGIVSEIRPDVHCNGADWGPGCIEREAVEKAGGRLHILGWAPGRSTSELLRRIRAFEQSPCALILAAGLLSDEALDAGGATLVKIVSGGLRLAILTEAGNDAARALLEKTGVAPDGAYDATCGGGASSSAEPLETIRDDLGIALGSSWVVSGEMRDVVMGRLVNAKTVLVGGAPDGPVMPHYQANTFAEALRLVLQK